jgi:hypothetical protein
VYSKAKNGRYTKGTRDSDFALTGNAEIRVAYIDVCASVGFGNETCVLRSRLLIHAILEVGGK